MTRRTIATLQVGFQVVFGQCCQLRQCFDSIERRTKRECGDLVNPTVQNHPRGCEFRRIRAAEAVVGLSRRTGRIGGLSGVDACLWRRVEDSLEKRAPRRVGWRVVLVEAKSFEEKDKMRHSVVTVML